jgi:RNA polymerase sigma factor (sigma-70 family)
MLQPRINLAEKFTTFLDIYSNNSSSLRWLRDRELSDNFQKNYNLIPKDSEEFWIQYWLEKNQQQNLNPLAHKHMASYLEETAYWVAKKQASNYSSFNYSWQDLMQVARINLFNQEKFSKLFDKYDSERGSITKLAKYKLGTVIYDFIHIGVEKRKYSDAALLRVVTPTLLRESLINADIKDTDKNKKLSQSLLAWYCFKEIYTPKQLTGTQRLEWANQEQLELITNRYNQLLSKPQQGINSGRSNKWLQSCVAALHNTAINSETLNKSLLTCVKALRHDISLTIESLDKPLGRPSDETQITLGDTLEANNFDDHEEEELQNQEWNEIQNIFINSYNQLSKEEQKMLQLKLGLSLAQEYIGVAFSIEQSTVSRRLNKAKRLILTDVVKESLQKFNVTPTNKMDDISQAVDACLVQYFKLNLGEFLTVNFPQSDYKNLEIFKLHYGQKLQLNKVAKRLDVTESALQERIDGVKQQLHLTLSEEVQRDLPLNSPESDQQKILAFTNEANQRISAFIDAWVKNAPYATFVN